MDLTPCGSTLSGRTGRMPPHRALIPAVALVLGISNRATGASEDPPDPVVHEDPDDAPFMRPPHGQAVPDGHAWAPTLTGADAPQAWVQLNIVPLYAGLHLDFVGRARGTTMHGGGVGLEGDVRVWRGLFLRLAGIYTAHPLRAMYTDPDDSGESPMKTAEGGTLHASGGSLGALYALDFGRFFPFVEAGVGLLWLISPHGVRTGQRGQPCLADGRCDPGLQCGGSARCELAPLPELHAGVGMDWLLTERLSFGAVVRYHALLREPSTFPVYLIVGTRLGARF